MLVHSRSSPRPGRSATNTIPSVRFRKSAYPVKSVARSLNMPAADPDHGSVPLITLNRTPNYQRLSDDHFESDTAYTGAAYQPRPTEAMGRGPLESLREARKGSTMKKAGLTLLLSYAFDWIVIVVVLGVAYYMDHHSPNRRPFSLEDPNIS